DRQWDHFAARNDRQHRFVMKKSSRRSSARWKKPRGATHWSSRGMAKASGLGRTTVQHIWRGFGLQLHRSETFKLSNDPLLIEKVRDIVGLYMNPTERAVVFCLDEKSQNWGI